jgi:hypothetical protein
VVERGGRGKDDRKQKNIGLVDSVHFPTNYYLEIFLIVAIFVAFPRQEIGKGDPTKQTCFIYIFSMV